jgi:hypothetical protein
MILKEIIRTNYNSTKLEKVDRDKHQYYISLKVSINLKNA